MLCCFDEIPAVELRARSDSVIDFGNRLAAGSKVVSHRARLKEEDRKKNDWKFVNHAYIFANDRPSFAAQRKPKGGRKISSSKG